MKSPPTLLNKLHGYLLPLKTLNSLPVLIFCTFIIHGIFYRIRLFISFTAEQELLIDDLVLFQIFSYLDGELYFALMILAVFAVTRGFLRPIKLNFILGFIFITAIIFVHFLFFTISLIYITHFHLIFNMHSGLTLDIIKSIFTESFLKIDAFSFIDFAFLLLMPILFWFFKLQSSRIVFIRNISVIMLSIFVLIISFMRNSHENDLAGREIKSNPVVYAIRNIVRQTITKKSNNGKTIPRKQMQSLAFIDGEYASGPIPAPLTRWGGKRKWNLLYIIMESTGSEYIFNTKLGNRFPMPFLKRLSEKSLYMTDHYSPANTSPRSLFSAFTGLYPAPREKMFVTRRDVRIPSILQFLGKEYNSFLVTPGSLRWFFPKGFYINNGVKLYGYYSLPKRKWKRSPSNSRNEIQTVDFFLKRLQKTPEPFVSIYYSYIAHWPYYYYGRDYDVFYPKELKTLPTDRLNTLLYNYYGNLRLMDVLIERIFNYMKKSGRLSRTIVIITGDHGEAFGQHRGNWIHSRGSFSENYRVPMIIYQPRLFEPKIITNRTLHIDLMPTLLDAMGIPYNPRLIQGESLYQHNFRRNYIFLYGNEKTITSISRSNIKIKISLVTRQCSAYDLNTDPGEKNRLECRKHAKQKRILLQYMKYQNRILHNYNISLKKGKAFFGERHPDLSKPDNRTKVKLRNQKKKQKRK